jgi:hypothetical protein
MEELTINNYESLEITEKYNLKQDLLTSGSVIGNIISTAVGAGYYIFKRRNPWTSILNL